ncbi:hypothetical protein [Plastoroseomonas hellenica]|uniref:hypothetical protein n=1 Tax=Plastoroseomonas hellenica TaxID=2687306 RepID=UPI001BAA5DA7|nr:hypothetical protein [Plastoroseomonas hellenica]MBR0641260.1 hypothetical protein [Plastoroseomonas hellenica]
MERRIQSTPGPNPRLPAGRSVSILLARVAAVALLAAGAFFGWVFHERYWLWRRCFNELGRCWDEVGEQVYVEQAGVIWGTLALVPLIAGLALLVWAHRHRS